jgi:hypothetical protein
MSMHMIYGVREPKSKIKPKKKPGWQQREAEYNAWLKSVGADVTPKRKNNRVYEPLVAEKAAYVRETPKYKSVSTGGQQVAAKHENPVYSGDYIVGIATMHKSNMVAVGAEDCPKSYSTMRRS